MKTFTKNEIDFILREWPKLTIEKIAESLGRTYCCVRAKIGRLRKTNKFPPNPRARAKTPALPEYQHKTCTKCNVSKPIFDFYKSHTHKDGRFNVCKKCWNVWNKTGFTPTATQGTPKYTKRLWTDSEIKYVRDNWGKKPLREIAEHINRHENVVRNKAKALFGRKHISAKVEPKYLAMNRLSSLLENLDVPETPKKESVLIIPEKRDLNSNSPNIAIETALSLISNRLPDQISKISIAQKNEVLESVLKLLLRTY